MQIVTIPNYIREIKLSESRMAKYYELDKKHPSAKMYQNKVKFDYRTFPGFGDRKFLTNLETGERVIANPRAVGTPRIMVINGQKIYNGDVSKHIRNMVMKKIKHSYASYIDKLEKIEKTPIKITLEVHDTIRESNSNCLWDLDNRAWPYIKAFQDCLTGNKDKNGKNTNKIIIEDDNILYITQPPAAKFIPVSTKEERKLVFIIEEENDLRILNQKDFKQELDEISRIPKRSK